MITKNHPSAYTNLFQKAQDVLKRHMASKYQDITITNIDDYFSVLRDLADIEAKYSDPKTEEYIDPIFTILPTTEETFNIDANSRKIIIPSDFAKYGIGVQGDEIAEILYFSIDRYFDAMDLADMDIIVQWRHSADKGVDGSLSATYKKSLTLQPGKIVFGWPITSEITKESGNIEFSVRFYRRKVDTSTNKEYLEYSFSTLPATVKIQTGLNFDLSSGNLNSAINRNTQIHTNLRNSTNYNPVYIIASPEFKKYFIYKEEERKNEDGTKTIDISFTETNPAAANAEYDLPVSFATKAEISNAVENEYINPTGLQYSWYQEGSATALNSTDVYKKVTNSSSYNPNEIYYHKNGENYEVHSISGDNNPFDDIDENGNPVTLYVKLTKFIPVIAGKYYTIAKNSYVQQGVSEKEVKSVVWNVPGPNAPEFTTPETTTIILKNNPTITIKALSKNPDKESISANWYYTTTLQDMEKADEIAGAIGDTYAPNQEGYYFVKAICTRNNAPKSARSNYIYCQNPASKIEGLRHYLNEIGDQPLENFVISDSNAKLIVTFNQLPEGDVPTYQWYKKLNAGDEFEPIPNATTFNYQATQSGYYKCIITNTRGIDSANPVESNIFVLMN